MYCSNCGNLLSQSANTCQRCGHLVCRPKLKSKVVFVLLAVFLGGLGIHRMYINDWRNVVFYLLFLWTGIPVIVALFEALVIGIRENDPRFEK